MIVIGAVVTRVRSLTTKSLIHVFLTVAVGCVAQPSHWSSGISQTVVSPAAALEYTAKIKPSYVSAKTEVVKAKPATRLRSSKKSPSNRNAAKHSALTFDKQLKTPSPKQRLVVKTPGVWPFLLNHKGLLGGYQRYLEEHYDVTYTTDQKEKADILIIMGYTRTFDVYQNYIKDFYRWLTGKDQTYVTPQYVCEDPAAMKVLYAHETWTSFPEGFDECFDLMIGYDQRYDHPRYLSIAGTAYEFFHEKISTAYDPKKDVWRAKGCQPEQRKYDVCFLASNGAKKDFMDLAKDRIDLFKAFSERTFVASGGKIENNIGYTVPLGDELDWMMNCKFVISYENRIYPGYVTEKPYQAWLAGAIPIYAAHRSVLGNVNYDALIFGPDYESNDKIVDRVMSLVDDHDAYCAIWNQPIHTDADKNFDVQQNKVTSKLVEITKQKFDMDGVS